MKNNVSLIVLVKSSSQNSKVLNFIDLKKKLQQKTKFP